MKFKHHPKNQALQGLEKNFKSKPLLRAHKPCLSDCKSQLINGITSSEKSYLHKTSINQWKSKEVPCLTMVSLMGYVVLSGNMQVERHETTLKTPVS